jgi:hypothetical protein
MSWVPQELRRRSDQADLSPNADPPAPSRPAKEQLMYHNNITKGTQLLRCLDASSADLPTVLASSNLKYQSQDLDSYAQLEEYGWIANVVGDENSIAMISGMEEAAQQIPSIAAKLVVQDDHICRRIVHDARYGPNEALLPTRAHFEVAYGYRCAVIASIDANGPDHQIRNNVRANLPAPALKHWSDIVFLEWQEQCRKNKTPIDQLSHVFRLNVTNDATKAAIDQALKSIGLERRQLYGKGWVERRTFSVDDEAAKALLGTPNGVGVAYLLLRYRKQLGRKKVKAVTIWGPNSAKTSQLSLYFELENVDV